MTSIAIVSELATDRFRWKTREGVVMRLCEMETSHVFNSMKMVFNHLATAHGGKPIWFQNQYSDYKARAVKESSFLGALVVFLCGEIVRRGNLPEKYREPFNLILDQVVGADHRSDGLLGHERVLQLAAAKS